MSSAVSARLRELRLIRASKMRGWLVTLPPSMVLPRICTSSSDSYPSQSLSENADLLRNRFTQHAVSKSIPLSTIEVRAGPAAAASGLLCICGLDTGIVLKRLPGNGSQFSTPAWIISSSHLPSYSVSPTLDLSTELRVDSVGLAAFFVLACASNSEVGYILSSQECTCDHAIIIFGHMVLNIERTRSRWSQCS